MQPSHMLPVSHLAGRLSRFARMGSMHPVPCAALQID